MKRPCWKVYYKNINAMRIEEYNIFYHDTFYSYVKKAYKENKDDFKAFEEKINSELRYYFWSNSTWEVVISEHSDHKRVPPKKIDAYGQVKMNWDIFIKYLWDFFNK